MFLRSVSVGRKAISFTSSITSRSQGQGLQFTRKFNNEHSSSSSSKSSINKNFLSAASFVTFGALAGYGAWILNQENSAEAKEEKKVALDPKEFVDFTLREVLPINHNTKIFRFNLATPDTELGLPIASCVVVKCPKADKDGKDVIRPYTPVSSNEQKGYVDLMVKIYPDGIASNYIWNLKKGDKLAIKGPIPKLIIKPNMKKNIGMVAGGTGLTPMLQVAREVLKNSHDKTNVSFIFANISEADILQRKELDELQAKHNNFKVYYVLEKPPKDWKQGVGYVNPEMLKKVMPPPSDDNLVLVCGPPVMVDKIAGSKAPDYSQGELKGFLKDLGYTSDQVFKF